MKCQDSKQKTGTQPDRREVLKWISSATAALPLLTEEGCALEENAVQATGYGPDPDLTRIYQPGELWPLTLSDRQRELVSLLCDLVMPEDESSPSASAVGVPAFLDEWISSPYPGQQGDRKLILKGLDWLEEEAARQGQPRFELLSGEEQEAICVELAQQAKMDRRKFPGSFFQRLRDLAAGGYYTTPEGMRDIGYRGNVPMPEWNGPPPEVLARLGLAGE